MYRIHILGASGSGCTTLASALARKLGITHLDTDSYFWEATDPPFTTKRDEETRLSMLTKDLDSTASWVLSGSLVGWGDSLRSRFSHVVFLSIPMELRLARLKQRERERFGSRIEAGGDMHSIHQDFLVWAAKYDIDGKEVQSRYMHEEWLKTLLCPLIRLETALKTEEQVQIICQNLLIESK